MTCGPYRPITLKTFSARIAEVQTCARVSGSLVPSLEVNVELAGTLSPSLIKTLRVVMTGPSGEAISMEEKHFQTGKEVFTWEFSRDEKKLWWPVGYGDQNLYTIQVSLLGNVRC